MGKKGRPKKKSKDNKKIKKFLENYDEEKKKHLEKLGTKLLKQDEIHQKLKSKKTKGKFLDNF